VNLIIATLLQISVSLFVIKKIAIVNRIQIVNLIFVLLITIHVNRAVYKINHMVTLKRDAIVKIKLSVKVIIVVTMFVVQI
jgi:hypothetical protein